MAVRGKLQHAVTFPRGENPVPLGIILPGHRFSKEKRRIERYFSCVKKY